MSETALWGFDEAVAAVSGRADGQTSAGISGISIDTRSLRKGELFVALKDARDGHEFVSAAFAAGASAALVANDYVKRDADGALIRVDDTLRGLEQLGVAARRRLPDTAHVIAVTGSAGKTGTKDMLRAALAALGTVHAAEKSFNNHWGVPLTLARMPRDAAAGVFEIGMNHPGEIRPLAKFVAPHAAIVTTVEAVHLAQFASVADIAQEKAEIFEGVVPGGTAIINRDNVHFPALDARARSCGLNILTFGVDTSADVRASALQLRADGSDIEARFDGRTVTFSLSIPGIHIARNSLAVVAALHAIGADVEKAVAALKDLQPLSGRGARHALTINGGPALLVDESYNANPASMRAAIENLGSFARQSYKRRIAVLGDMLELGDDAEQMHRDLASAIAAAGVDVVFASGPLMRGLYDAVPPALRGAYAEQSDGLEAALLAALDTGDVVMVKGSNGSRMGPIATLLRDRFAKRAPG